MKDWMDIRNRVYIVTGGSCGIGEAVVRELLDQEAYVIDADLNAPAFEDERLRFVKTDVTKRDDVQTMVDKTIDEFGKIDGLVNNAGINLPRLLADAKAPDSKYVIHEDDFDKMFSVNVKSVYLVSQAVVKEMVGRKTAGVVVNMSSEAGLEGSQGQSVYSATKGAINGFTRSWAKELGNLDIRVVGVAPGIMEATGLRTLSYEKALAYTRNKTVDELRAGYNNTSTIPMGRSGKLVEVADLVSYLLSDRSSYITGVTINIAGGKSRG